MDAPVTNTVAVRRAGTVVYEGFVVAESIVADLALIARAPARLNRAGVGDLLSIHTGRFDWALGARAGTVAFDAAIDAAAAAALLVPDLAHEVEVDRAAGEVELLDDAGLEVPPVLLRELFLAVAEQPDAERTVAGLGRVIDAETPAGDRRGRVA